MDAFLVALGPAAQRLRDSDAAWLEELCRSVELAAEKFPGIPVNQADFASHVAALVEDLEPGTRLCCDDLYLAFAAGGGNEAALRIFEREHMALVPAFIAKYQLDADQLLEVLQRVRERVLVGEVGEPRILTYSGQGRLGGWLRMVAVRAAVDFLRQAGREPRTPEIDVPDADPELLLVKARYVEEFRRAIQLAMSQLSDRQATLLQLRYGQQLELQGIAAVYRVTPRTVQRWLGEAHDELNRKVRKALTMDKRLTERDVQSLLLLVQSQLDITLSALLRSSPQA